MFIDVADLISLSLDVTEYEPYTPPGPKYNRGEKAYILHLLNSLAPQSLEFAHARVKAHLQELATNKADAVTARAAQLKVDTESRQNFEAALGALKGGSDLSEQHISMLKLGLLKTENRYAFEADNCSIVGKMVGISGTLHRYETGYPTEAAAAYQNYIIARAATDSAFTLFAGAWSKMYIVGTASITFQLSFSGPK